MIFELLQVDSVVHVKVLENIITDYDLPIVSDVIYLYNRIGIFCPNKRYNVPGEEEWPFI